MKQKVFVFSGLIAAAVLLTLLQTTTPTQIGPVGILFIFGLMYVSALSGLTLLLYWVSRLIGRLAKRVTIRRPYQSLSLTHSYYYASVLALAPVMFVGMASVGANGGREVLLVVLFITLACVYVRRRTV